MSDEKEERKEPLQRSPFIEGDRLIAKDVMRMMDSQLHVSVSASTVCAQMCACLYVSGPDFGLREYHERVSQLRPCLLPLKCRCW